MLKFITLSIVIALSMASWVDDRVISWDSRSGWRMFSEFVNYRAAYCKDINNEDGPCERVTNAGTAYEGVFYGPFINSPLQGKLKMLRRVECTTQATMEVTYKIASCNDNPRVKVFVSNNKYGVLSASDDDFDPISYPELEDIDSGCTEYEVEQQTRKLTQVVDGEEPFEVFLQVRVYTSISAVYLFDIEFKCIENTEVIEVPSCPGCSTFTMQNEYCITGLPAFSDSGVNRGGEFEILTKSNAEDTDDYNNNHVFEKDNDHGNVFLYEDLLTDGTRQWVFGDAGYAKEEQFAHCLPPTTTATVPQDSMTIDHACGCDHITTRCTGIYDMSDNVIPGVWIEPYSCPGGHVVIESDAAPASGSFMTPFGMISMDNQRAMMGLLTSLCVASFLLGMFTLCVCHMAWSHKGKPYQKVHPKDVDGMDDEEVLAEIIS